MTNFNAAYNTDTRPLVYIVGLSVKPDCEHLDPETKTGHVVQQIINRLPSAKIIRTNLVRTPPLNKDGKLRYPSESEMALGWDELKSELHQTGYQLLVALGYQVSSFLRSQMGIRPTRSQLPPDFSYRDHVPSSLSPILTVHHPSFVLIYRRKHLENYINNVVGSISYLLSRSPVMVGGAARPTEPPRPPEPMRCLVCAGRRRVYLGAGRVRWYPVCGGDGLDRADRTGGGEWC